MNRWFASLRSSAEAGKKILIPALTLELKYELESANFYYPSFIVNVEIT